MQRFATDLSMQALVIASIPLMSVPIVATAGDADVAENPGGLAEIVVTAEKRAEPLSRVPMSITALSGDQLSARGVSATQDLAKVVPGLEFSQSITGTPVYTLRGIGFNDTAAGARPTVTVYVDEVPLPFSIETLGAGLDLERVEVLKGPQGTLFGENATGGAINYIAAKPTKEFAAGATASYGNFNRFDAEGFLSGPLSETVSARLAVRHEGGSGWQESATRTDTLGKRDLTIARLLLDWNANDALRVNVNINGYINRSDSQAGQFLQWAANSPAFTFKVPTAIVNTPPPPADTAAADWNPGVNYAHDDRFYQAAIRADWNLSQSITLTSISNYLQHRGVYNQDPDGTPYLIFNYRPTDDLRTFSQELRASFQLADGLRAIAGGNYQHDRVYDRLYETLAGTASFSLSALPGGPAQFTESAPTENETADTYAAFANLDYDIASSVTLHAGARYTKDTTDFNECTFDGGDGANAQGFAALVNLLRGATGQPPITNSPGSCVTINSQTLAPGVVYHTLDEHNVSWRAGVDWKLNESSMVYANVSKGYKAGGFPVIGGTFSTQYNPATQESVLAYELGTKSTLFDRTLQMTGAVFYYDYKDKQVLGVFDTGIFGAASTEVNVPKSDEKGAELQATWLPFPQLTLSGGVTYLDSRIKDDFLTINLLNKSLNARGEAFPFTPKWDSIIDAEFHGPLSWRNLTGFFGVSGKAQSSSNSEIGDLPQTHIAGYATLDLRAGLRGDDDQWSLTFWSRNVTNKYFWNDATKYQDTFVRFTGMPRTYGATVNYRIR